MSYLAFHFVTRESSLEGSLKTSKPPAQKARPFNSGRSSAQRGEKVGIVHRALNATPLWKLKRFSENHHSVTGARALRNSSNTNRRIRKVVGHDSKSASRGLSEGRVTEAKLFNKECIVAQEVGRLLRIGERGDRVSLRIIRVRQINRAGDGMHEPCFRLSELES